MSGDTFDIVQGNRDTITGTLHDPQATAGDVLTVQADKSIAAQPGGGGSGGVQVVTVPISSAQILDLEITPVTLIAVAPGFVAVVLTTAVAYIAGVTPYLDGGGNMQITNGVDILTAFATAGFWDQVAGQFRFDYVAASGGATAGYDGADVALQESVANPTLGDGTLLVTLSYFLAPTV